MITDIIEHYKPQLVFIFNLGNTKITFLIKRGITMLLERIILALVWIITILGLIRLTPRNQIRDAHVIFLFKQVLTWIFGLLVVQFHLIEYPVRMLHKATMTSFSFEYFIYPA